MQESPKPQDSPKQKSPLQKSPRQDAMVRDEAEEQEDQVQLPASKDQVSEQEGKTIVADADLDKPVEEYHTNQQEINQQEINQ